MTEVITYSSREAELLAAARVVVQAPDTSEAIERLRLAVQAYPTQPSGYDPRNIQP